MSQGAGKLNSRRCWLPEKFDRLPGIYYFPGILTSYVWHIYIYTCFARLPVSLGLSFSILINKYDPSSQVNPGNVKPLFYQCKCYLDIILPRNASATPSIKIIYWADIAADETSSLTVARFWLTLLPLNVDVVCTWSLVSRARFSPSPVADKRIFGSVVDLHLPHSHTPRWSLREKC